MFHGPFVVVNITHAYIVFIVAVGAVEGGVNRSQNKI